MDAKKLADFLKTSDDPEIAALADNIERTRSEAIECIKKSDSPESVDYWKKHKLVAIIHTDWDFYIKEQDSEQALADVSLEWIGNTREDVVLQAKNYLTNSENFVGSEKNINYFIKDYAVKALEHISLGDTDEWTTGGNWEVDISYHEPDESKPEIDDHQPFVTFFDERINLLTGAELDELGFTSSED